MRETSGNIWPTPLTDSDNNEMAVLDRTRDTRYFEMRTESMLRFFDKIGIKKNKNTKRAWLNFISDRIINGVEIKSLASTALRKRGQTY